MWYPIGFTVAANPSAAVVKINEDGTATLLTGTVETGQGSLTILAQIVAQELGIATDDVHVVSADTDTTPMDTGAIASRTTYVTGNAARLAAAKVKHILLELAAPVLGVKPSQREVAGHKIQVGGFPHRTVHIGAETRMSVLLPRVGINQGYFCGGLGLDLKYFTLDVGTYGEEMSLNPGGLGDRRYTAKIAIQI
jgi:CO/xanthine dehydrogenase Mo-binding subunit